MGLIKAIKSFRWGYLLISIILCLAGACFIIYPTQTMTTGSYIIAGSALLVGIVLVIKVLADRKRSFSFAVSVISSVLTVTCGVVALIIPEEVFKLYPMFIGLFIIIDGSFKLQTVINAKRYKLKMWWFLLIFAVLSIVGGFLLVRLRIGTDIQSLAFSEIMGVTLFACGLENFFSLFFLGKIVNKAMESIKEEQEKQAEKEEEKNPDVYEDSSIADSYTIKDDDNIITVEIIPKEEKELTSSDNNILSDNKEGSNALSEGNTNKNDKEKTEDTVVSNLPVKSPYEAR